MNVLKAGSKRIQELEIENQKLKNKILNLESRLKLIKDIADSDKIIYESNIKNLRNLLYISSFIIMLLGVAFSIWR